MTWVVATLAMVLWAALVVKVFTRMLIDDSD